LVNKHKHGTSYNFGPVKMKGGREKIFRVGNEFQKRKTGRGRGLRRVCDFKSNVVKGWGSHGQVKVSVPLRNIT